MTFDPYETTLFVIGCIGLSAAVIHRSIKSWPISMSVVLTALGALVFAAVPALQFPDLRNQLEFTEKLTEAGVLISLMAAGLSIDRPMGWSSWMPTWRLLSITMPLTIGATAFLGSWLLGLDLASAVLLGAVLAPTDPVIADELTVDGPADGGDAHDDDNIARSTLTSEAGLNDALAFPFVYLAIAINDNGIGLASLGEWFARDVVLRLGVGLVVGIAVGRGIAWLAFHNRRDHLRLSTTAQGFVALAATLIAYSAAELLYGYGFLAVFVAAVAFRREERDHDYHRVLHDFTDQLERVVIIGLLVALGGAFLGGILDATTVAVVVTATVVIGLVRPATGIVALVGVDTNRRDKWTMAAFGIRGIGSIYYLAYALRTTTFSDTATLWAVVAVTILVSIVVHGFGATFARRQLTTT